MARAPQTSFAAIAVSTDSASAAKAAPRTWSPALLAAFAFCAPHIAWAQTPAPRPPSVSAASAASTAPTAPAATVSGTPAATGTQAPAGASAAIGSAAPSAPATGGSLALSPVAAEQAPLLAAPAPSWAREGLLSSTLWGGRGIHRVASAYPLTKGAFVLSVGADYFRGRSLFVAGDRDAASGQNIHAAYSPVHGLEISLSHQSSANNYQGLTPRNLQLQGNPTLRLKYGRHVRGPLALGVLGSATLPTVQGNAGALARAMTFTASGLLSIQPAPWFELVGNVGFVYDRSRHVFAGEVPDIIQRFVFDINATSSARWGLGASGRIRLANKIDLLPFAEASGDIGIAKAATHKNNPARVSAGLRLYPSASRAIELTVGSDVRISGGPKASSPFSGVPPWRAFAQLTVHLGEGPARSLAVAEASAPVQAKTFRIRGHAVDVDTGQPVVGASIHLAGDEALLLFGVDEQTGQFVSAPQPAGAGSLHLVARAPGYGTTELDVQRSTDGHDVETTFSLKAEPHGSKLALLKGSLQDSETGEAVVGAEVRIVALKRVLRSDRAGAFAALLRPGRYSVFVSAPGYEPQRKMMNLRAGESMVLHMDLTATANASAADPTAPPATTPAAPKKAR